MFDDIGLDPSPAACAFLITGIPGSGKTTVAQAMARRFLLAAQVDDDLMISMIVSGNQPPTNEGGRESTRQILLRARNAALLIDSFAAAGVVPVFDDVVVRRSHLDYYRERVKTRPFHVVVLAPSLEVALRRDSHREKHVAGVWAHLDAVLRDELSGEGIWVDSSNLTTGQTVDAILAKTAPDFGSGSAADVR
jgi:gluconate kinase